MTFPTQTELEEKMAEAMYINNAFEVQDMSWAELLTLETADSYYKDIIKYWREQAKTALNALLGSLPNIEITGNETYISEIQDKEEKMQEYYKQLLSMKD
jgi:hypothetical protein